MNAERLLGQYERIADAPDATMRLRRFILDLAVRGKLVPQDPKDEPASELLKRIAAEKVRLLKAREIKKPPVLDPIGESDTPFLLPLTWKWVRVGEIFNYDAGAKREPRELIHDRWLLELEDIEKDTSVIVSRVRVSDRDSRSTKSEFEVGDILYGKLRPYLNKVVVADEPGYSTCEIVAIRPFLKLCPEYCALAFRRPDFVAYVERLGRGTKMPRLRTPDAIVAAFPLPPMAEQHRIVAKVEELMVLCDRLETARSEREARRDRLMAASFARLNAPDLDTFRHDARFVLNALPAFTTRPDQIKQVRQAILSLAVIGKLTDIRRDSRPALDELRSIQAKKLELALKKPKAITPVSVEEQWCALPKRWEWARWDQITDWITYGFTRPMPHQQDGVPIVTAKNVNDGRLNFESAHRTPVEAFRRLSEKDRPKRGDILLTKDASIGRTAIVENDEPFCINQSVAVLWLRSCHFNRRYLQLAIDCPQTQQALLAKTEGVAIKHISIIDFGKMVFPLPPLAEQHCIVSKVDELMALCDQLELSLTIGNDTRRSMLEALLHDVLTSLESLTPEQDCVDAGLRLPRAVDGRAIVAR